MEFRSRYTKPVVKLLDIGSHQTKIFDYGRDAIRFFYPKLGCVADLEPGFELSAEYRENGKLVDQISDYATSYLVVQLLLQPPLYRKRSNRLVVGFRLIK